MTQQITIRLKYTTRQLYKESEDLYIVVNKEINKKEVLQCRSCHNTFHQSDVKEVKTERCGLEINEKTCPHCGGHTYGYIEYPVSEEKLIYHSNFPSELKLHMDLLVSQILREDKLELDKVRFVKEVNMERRVAMA